MIQAIKPLTKAHKTIMDHLCSAINGQIWLPHKHDTEHLIRTIRTTIGGQLRSIHINNFFSTTKSNRYIRTPTFEMCKQFHSISTSRLRFQQEWKDLSLELRHLAQEMTGKEIHPQAYINKMAGLLFGKIELPIVTDIADRKKPHVVFHYAIEAYFYCVLRILGIEDTSSFYYASRYARYAAFLSTLNEKGIDFEALYNSVNLKRYCDQKGLIHNVIINLLSEFLGDDYTVHRSFCLIRKNEYPKITAIYDDDGSGVCRIITPELNLEYFNRINFLYKKNLERKTNGFLESMLNQQSFTYEDRNGKRTIRVAGQNKEFVLLKAAAVFKANREIKPDFSKHLKVN